MRAQSMSERVPTYTSKNVVVLSPSVSSQLSRTTIPFILGAVDKKVCLLCTVQLLPNWKEEQEGTASELQRPGEVDRRMGRKCGSGDGQNPGWGRHSGAKQTSAVTEGQKYRRGRWTC